MSNHFGSIDVKTDVDPDYAGDAMDCKSIYGLVVKLGGAFVVWECTKQTVTALSTC